MHNTNNVIPLLELGSRLPSTIYLCAHFSHVSFSRNQILTRYSESAYLEIYTSNFLILSNFNSSFSTKYFKKNCAIFSAAPLQHRYSAMEENEVTATETTNAPPPPTSPNNKTITDRPVALDVNSESDSSSTEEEKSTSGAISAEIAPRTPNKRILDCEPDTGINRFLYCYS